MDLAKTALCSEACTTVKFCCCLQHSSFPVSLALSFQVAGSWIQAMLVTAFPPALVFGAFAMLQKRASFGSLGAWAPLLLPAPLLPVLTVLLIALQTPWVLWQGETAGGTMFSQLRL